MIECGGSYLISLGESTVTQVGHILSSPSLKRCILGFGSHAPNSGQSRSRKMGSHGHQRAALALSLAGSIQANVNCQFWLGRVFDVKP